MARDVLITEGPSTVSRIGRRYPSRGSKYKLTFKAGDAARYAGKGAKAGMEKVSKKLERGMKSFCPVDSGKLRSSIRVEVVSRGPNPRFEVRTVDYGSHVENGTINMDAQPFIRPVMIGLRKQWVREVATEGKKYVNKSGKRR